MRHASMVTSIVALALFVVGCSVKENIDAVRAREDNQRVLELQMNADQVVASIRYMKDQRTGLCFAYRWGSKAFDGPSLALATVPCEAIPPQLLTTAK